MTKDIYNGAGIDNLTKATQNFGWLSAGEVRVTDGFDLLADFIAHAVGPRWIDGSHGEADDLAKTYKNVLLEAEKRRIDTVCFPALGVGYFRYPLQQPADIALKTVSEFQCTYIAEIRFVFTEASKMKAFKSTLQRIKREKTRQSS